MSTKIGARHVIFGMMGATVLLLATASPSCGGPKDYRPPPPMITPAEHSGSSVYNAIFEPSVNRTVLLHNVPTRLRFFVGPHDSNSGIPSDSWTVNPNLIKNPANVPLTVTMNCLVCSGESAFQKRAIAFFGSQGTSSEAVFEVTPDRSLTDAGTGSGAVILDVSGRGIPYDHIVVNVVVEAEAAAANVTPPRNVGNNYSVPDRNESVDLTISVMQTNEGVGLILVPDGHLEKAFADRHLQGSNFRVFQTRLKNSNEINTLTSSAYLKIRRIVDRFGVDDPKSISLATRAETSTALFDLGASLYDRLFNPELISLIGLVERLSSPENPLKIRIESQGIYLPWQLIRPFGDPQDIRSFWGFKFQLAIQPPLIRGVKLASALNQSQVGRDKAAVWLLRYRTTGVQSGSNDVSDNGDQLAKYISKTIGEGLFVDMSSKKELMTTIARFGSSLQLLVVYSHASSGTRFRLANDGSIVPEPEITADGSGPRLILHNDNVYASDMERLRFVRPSDAPLLLPQQPIVLLDGCETGSMGVAPMTSFALPSVLLELGARGVIVTEGPIEASMGLHFGQKLIEKVLQGNELPSAVQSVRLEYLNVNNPFGLLFSYYGHPLARIQR